MDHQLITTQIEGLFTILVAGIFAAFFPGTPKNAKSLAGFRYFNERELHILNQRIYLDDPSWWVTTHRTYLVITTTISLPRLP
jgi:hypothetical protein